MDARTFGNNWKQLRIYTLKQSVEVVVVVFFFFFLLRIFILYFIFCSFDPATNFQREQRKSRKIEETSSSSSSERKKELKRKIKWRMRVRKKKLRMRATQWGRNRGTKSVSSTKILKGFLSSWVHTFLDNVARYSRLRWARTSVRNAGSCSEEEEKKKIYEKSEKQTNFIKSFSLVQRACMHVEAVKLRYRFAIRKNNFSIAQSALGYIFSFALTVLGRHGRVAVLHVYIYIIYTMWNRWLSWNLVATIYSKPSSIFIYF